MQNYWYYLHKYFKGIKSLALTLTASNGLTEDYAKITNNYIIKIITAQLQLSVVHNYSNSALLTIYLAIRG